jgi:protein SCO1/2
LRGQPVVIAFAFAHCQTICPLIVRDVNAALDRLRDRRVVALIVTVDPWRDTPERLPHIARQWQLGDGAHVLSGTVAEVSAVLAAWRIGIGRDPRTGDVTHAGAVYLVAPDGHLAYALPASSEVLATHIREVASR